MPITDLVDLNPGTAVAGIPEDALVSFIPMADVTEGGEWVNHQTRRLSEVRRGYTAFREADVLFAKITPCMENGKGCHALGLANGLGFGTTEFHVLRRKSGTDSRFIYHVAQSAALRLRAEALMVGSAGQQRVHEDFFSKYAVPSFTEPEQTKIAEMLDIIDAAIWETAASIGKLKLIRIGLVHDLLTRGIDENGELRDPLAHPKEFVSSPIGRVPIAWNIVTLGAVIAERGGTIQTGPFGSQLHADEYVEDGVPVVMPQDILNGKIVEHHVARITEDRASSLHRHRMEFGDVILARRGDLSRCAAITSRSVGWLCGTGCLLVRTGAGRDGLNTRWLVCAYQHDRCQRQIASRAVGSTMANLNTSLLSDLVIARPMGEEQDGIVDRITGQDDLIDAEETELNKLRLLKAGLMQDLLTGRVRVPSSTEAP